jgi:hypothetical protein
MMTMFEDLGLALRQICRAIGLSGTAATVVPVIVLGVALNAVALSATGYLSNGRHSRRHSHTALQSAVRTELKVVRTVLHSTLRRIGDGQRRWCLMQQWMIDRQREFGRYKVEVGSVCAAPSGNQSCGVEIIGSHHRKATTVFVQC